MNSENSTTNSVPKAVLGAIPKLVEVLTPLSVDDRQRAISATMILFGQPSPAPTTSSKTQTHEEQIEPADGISGKGAAWMKKNTITREQLEHVFCIESDSIDVIAASMPAKGKRQQTVQAYVICGLKSYLKTGEPDFTDAEGRELCNKVGCYDMANHSNYRKAFGNLLNGSKESGWKLQTPDLVRLQKSSNNSNRKQPFNLSIGTIHERRTHLALHRFGGCNSVCQSQ